jgi:hypothetical protein
MGTLDSIVLSYSANLLFTSSTPLEVSLLTLLPYQKQYLLNSMEAERGKGMTDFQTWYGIPLARKQFDCHLYDKSSQRQIEHSELTWWQHALPGHDIVVWDSGSTVSAGHFTAKVHT